MPVLPGDNPEGFPLPPTPDAPRICVTLEIPNDPTHIANFIGALRPLTLWNSYRAVAGRKNKPTADVWRDIVFGIKFEACHGPFVPPVAEDDYIMSICEQLRVNNGILEGFCCGEWVPIDGQGSQGLGGPGQPGDGSPIPQPGTCQQYHASLAGNGLWLLPPVVNSGDTLEISGADGVFFTGFGTEWACPDGNQFFITCTGITHTDAGSQIPSVPVGKLIAKIGGSYYDIFGGTFTVPGGIVNQPVEIMQNTPNLSGAAGNVTFDITYCNNQGVVGDFVVSYIAGSGPATVHPGDSATMFSGVVLDNNYIQFDLDRPAKITVIFSNLSVVCNPCGFSFLMNPIGTITQTLSTPTNADVTEYAPGSLAQEFEAASGAGGSPWQMIIKLDNL